MRDGTDDLSDVAVAVVGTKHRPLENKLLSNACVECRAQLHFMNIGRIPMPEVFTYITEFYQKMKLVD